MAQKLIVELQDDQGNVYYLHAVATAVFCTDGKTVQDKIGTVKGRIATKDSLKLVTEANYLAEAKAVRDCFDELNGKLLHAKNTSQSGWKFYRVGNLVFFTHNKTLSVVAANTKYTNQGKAPTGYRPAERYYATGTRSAGVSTVTGDFYFELAVDGTAIFISTASHSEAQSYTVSGCYVTTDAFPTADKV